MPPQRLAIKSKFEYDQLTALRGHYVGARAGEAIARLEVCQCSLKKKKKVESGGSICVIEANLVVDYWIQEITVQLASYELGMDMDIIFS